MEKKIDLQVTFIDKDTKTDGIICFRETTYDKVYDNLSLLYEQSDNIKVDGIIITEIDNCDDIDADGN